MRASAIVVALLTALLAAPAGQHRSATPPVIVPVDADALNGLRENAQGKVVLVNFWATWCEPCVEEFPDLVRLRSQFRTQGLECIFVTIDEPGSLTREVSAFLRRMKVDFTTYVKAVKDDEAFINSVNRRWTGAIPATFIYGRDGTLAYSLTDSRTFEDLSALVAPLLAEHNEE